MLVTFVPGVFCLNTCPQVCKQWQHVQEKWKWKEHWQLNFKNLVQHVFNGTMYVGWMSFWVSLIVAHWNGDDKFLGIPCMTGKWRIELNKTFIWDENFNVHTLGHDTMKKQGGHVFGKSALFIKYFIFLHSLWICYVICGWFNGCSCIFAVAIANM